MNIRIRWFFLIGWIIVLAISGCERETATQGTTGLTDSPSQPAATLASTPTSIPSPTAELSEGVIADVIHQVDAHPKASGDWETALVDMLLYAGGEVWAKEESTALIGLGERQMVDGAPNFIRVAPNTIFTLERPEPGTAQLNLQEGQVWINIEGLSTDESFDVQTSTAVASVEGTRFSVRVDEAGQTVVSTMVNTVTVSTAEGSVQVGPKKQTTVQTGEMPTEPDRISDVDYIRWGLAAGPNLSVITPIGDLVDRYKTPGMTFPGIWSGDGRVFSFEVYRPDLAGRKNFIHHYNVSTSTPITATVVPTETFYVSYSPVGGGVAWLQNGNQGMEICSSQSHQDSPVCFNPPSPGYLSTEPAWSPDGELLLYQLNSVSPDGADNLYISQLDGSETIQLTDSITGSNGQYAWSPDGSQIAYSYAYTDDWDTPGEAWVVDVDGSNPTLITGGLYHPLSSTPISWSPDGAWLALQAMGNLSLYRPDGSEENVLHEGNGGDFFNLQWSPTPTGWPLLYSYFNSAGPHPTSGNYFIYDQSAEPQDYYLGVWGPVYSPDGKLAAYGSSVKISENVYESTLYFFQVLPWWP